MAGLTGEQRYFLYLIAIAAGFRASELRSLCSADFRVRSRIPHIVLSGENARNHKETQQPIQAETAVELARWLTGKPAKQPLWPGLWHKKAAKMLRTVLVAARVQYRVNVRVLDFHSLRGTFITSLSREGVHPRKAQILALHSDINLTKQSYTHLTLEEIAEALPKRAPNAHHGGGIRGHFGSQSVTSENGQKSA